MKLFKKLSLAFTCFLASVAAVGCSPVEKVGSIAGYHKVGAPEIVINSEVYEEYADFVEIKFYESKDGEIGDLIKPAKTFVRAGKDVIMTVGAINTLALDGEITCDIKTVKLIDRAAEEKPTPTPEEPVEGPKEALRKAETVEEEKEPLPVIAEYVFEMPDSTPTFSFKFVGTLPHVHEFATAWEATEEGHYHVCACGEKTALEAHTFDEGTVTKEATESESGTKVYKCTVCEYEKTEEIIYVPAESTEETPETPVE